jgi:hypothetical protein
MALLAGDHALLVEIAAEAEPWSEDSDWTDDE